MTGQRSVQFVIGTDPPAKILERLAGVVPRGLSVYYVVDVYAPELVVVHAPIDSAARYLGRAPPVIRAGGITQIGWYFAARSHRIVRHMLTRECTRHVEAEPCGVAHGSGSGVGVRP